MSKSDYRDIRVRGGKYHRFAEAVKEGWLVPRAHLVLRRQPDNDFDSRAVAVYVLDGKGGEVQVGHVSTEHVGKLYWRLDRGAVIMKCIVLNLDENRQSLNAHLELQGGWKALTENLQKVDNHDLDDDIPF